MSSSVGGETAVSKVDVRQIAWGETWSNYQQTLPRLGVDRVHGMPFNTR